MKTSIRRLLPVVAGLVLASAGHVQACAQCFSGGDSRTGPGLNGAIFFMLGILGTVFTGIGTVAYGIYRRRHLGPRA